MAETGIRAATRKARTAVSTPRHLREAIHRVIAALLPLGLASAMLAASGNAPAAAATASSAANGHPTLSHASATRGLSPEQAQKQAKSTGRPVVITSMTTPASTTTANPNGSFTLDQSLQPVRAWRDGGWVPLDPALHAHRDGTIAPAVTTNSLVLSGGGNGPLAVMANAGRSLSLSWPGWLPSPVLSGATATYHSVMPGVDLAVTASPQGGFTDVLIVKNAAAAANPLLRSLSLTAAAPGLRLTSAPGGAVRVATSSQAAPVFTMPASRMWDSTPQPAGTATAMGPGGAVVTASSGLPATSTIAAPGAAAHVTTLPLTASGNTIAIRPPAAALTGPGVTYPVYIDPSTYDDPLSTTAGEWTQVDKGFPGQTYWKESSDLQVGRCDFSGCNGLDVARSFARFPISSHLYGATIEYSYFYMTDLWAPSCTDTAAQLWTTGGITSSTDWSNQPSWNTQVQQKSFAYQDIAGTSCPYQKDDVTWDISSIMQRDANDQYTAQTFGIRAADETNDMQWKQFHSGSSYLHLSTKYNLPPERPSSRATDPGGSCVYSASSAPVIGNDDVTFSAYVADYAGYSNSLTTRFLILDSNGNTVYDSSAKGTSVKTGDFTTAALTLTRSVMQGLRTNGATTVYTYHWYARTTDGGGLTSAMPVHECYFTYNPLGPSAPAVTPNPVSGQLGQAVSASFAPSAPNCSPTTKPCPVSYTYQLGAATPVTVPADSSGNWSGTIPLRRAGPGMLTVYATDSAGNVSEAATPAVDVTPPATPYGDADINGDGEPDLLRAGTTSNAGLWLAPGSGPGTLHRPIQIGGAGTGINPGTGGPSDWAGAIVLHGNFTGQNIQDVMVYYPTGTHAGTGEIIGGTGDGSPLQPASGSQSEIPAGSLYDIGFSQVDQPMTLVAAGNASQLNIGVPDLIGVLGDPTNGYELDLFTSTPGLAGNYSYTTTLSPATSPAPGGTSDWNNYQLATAQPGGNPAATVLIALDTATGALYESTNPANSTTALIGTAGTWTQIAVPWGTNPPTLASADVNAAGQTELWTTSGSGGSTATPYNLSGNTVTAETATTLTKPSHQYPIAEGTGTTASDTIGTLNATVAGTATWTDPGTDDNFTPSLDFDGSTNYLSTSSPAINTTSSYTISAWARLNPAPGTIAPDTRKQTVAAQDGTTDSGFYLAYSYVNGGVWEFNFPNSDITSPTYTSVLGPSAAVGVWTHLVAVYDASAKTATLYVNGVQVGTTSFTTAWNATGPFTIGRGKIDGNMSQELDGTIADVQSWQSPLTATQIAATGGITGSGPITSAVSGKCLDDWHNGTSDGTVIDIYSCNSAKAQNWSTSPGPATTSPTDTIQINGKCLDVNGGGTTNGTLIDLYKCNNTGSQQWQPGPNGSLINPQSGKCLDDPGNTTTNGTQIQLYTCDGSTGETWTLP
jgi:Concanavalin A-like lectin/glucanases superfamily/Ricin-type beta-trefoil lectin domain